MQYNFEWDSRKARINARKHGINFNEATKIFSDPLALTILDDENDDESQERWVTLGQINGQHYLVVVHTYRNETAEIVTIRLISARPATKHEIRQYEQG